MKLAIAITRWGETDVSRDLLVLGPSLGTSAATLWGRCAPLLTDVFDVVGWDLPGHGVSAPTTTPFEVADLAATVGDLVAGRRAWYAGVSLGGAVGFHLAAAGTPFSGVATIASAPVIGTPGGWLDRAELVRQAGTPVMVEGSARRWFAPGFIDRDPATAGALLTALSDTDRESYALACEALARFDLTGTVTGATPALTVLLGEHDVVVPVGSLDDMHPVVLPGCGHLPPAEDPGGVADTLRRLFVPQEVVR